MILFIVAVMVGIFILAKVFGWGGDIKSYAVKELTAKTKETGLFFNKIPDQYESLEGLETLYPF